MLFNSLDFAVFLPIVFFLYWFVFKNNLRSQNLLIVVASYVFYGWWDWRFLALIAFSTLVDYLIGIELGKEGDRFKRRGLLIISILVNIGFLGFFKYYNFFLDNFITAFSIAGMPIKANTLNIILPVGISFYTFQTLSYSIDVYRRKLEPTRDWISFTAFVSFFPQLVAGPIERATNLLPQFYKKRIFDSSAAVDGLKQILWGLFKKMVIADNCAEYANLIFNNSSDYSGSTLVLGAFFFAFQIYGDFSGYSDIAIGTSRLFGFNLMQNFAFPYFSRDIAEFWRRWHMSLTTWFRDYVYIPLGGSRGSLYEKIRNTFIIFLVSGFWHGANWTFIVWGALNAIYFLPSLILGKNRKNLDVPAEGNRLPSFREAISILSTFILTVFAWIFFRVENMSHASSFISGIFTKSLFSMPNFTQLEGALTLLVLIAGFILIEWKGRVGQYAISNLGVKRSRFFRWSMYILIILSIDIFGNTSEEIEFIYFQF
ncbi:putative membrane protein involved in D-alanine export [Belliella baltica DSM 15883]|uniref:Putative membrane protein involved in D-alanine export n=1 Tax=Belliella baltica (strain DSM 15883 / CIP 108006 / LMG 21964 / BA134) TaxID=866536 RepID=I3Z525_BELBD|nr:MBOAT family O-acyltransferase [Belliella baltica]AFL84343.1 putative membrane protein involved in D-alanine export [Belliella baltica DSM 15883]